VMRAEALNEMPKRLNTVFQTGAVTIIDQMAETMGRHSAKETIEDFGAKFATNQLDELIGTYSALGHADVSIERSKSAEFPFVINAKEMLECEANAKQRLRRKSTLFRAHLRGFMSGVFDTEFDVNEVQCVTGRDEVNTFRVALSVRAASNFATVVPEHSRKDSPQSKF